MRFISPLRYPGGKGRFAPFFTRIIRAQIPSPTHYAEPYAGGAGAALHLLNNGVVDYIHINDINAGIAAFWRTITTKHGAEDFCRLIEKTAVDIDEWYQQQDIYRTAEADDLTLGFATFYLNRTNRSGILDAGPIGGIKQEGKWKIDARYNKKTLIERVQHIASLGKNIHVTELDGLDFLETMENYKNKILVYADPPYVEQGEALYLHAFDTDDHRALADHLLSAEYPWLLTYDDQEVIWDELYRNVRCSRFDIAHTAAIQHIGKETIVYSPNLIVPEGAEITPGVTATRIK